MDEDGLTGHFVDSPWCKDLLPSSGKLRDPHAFTAELDAGSKIKTAVFSGTVPDTLTVVSSSSGGSLRSLSSSRTTASFRSSFEDASLFRAMESGMKKKPMASSRKSGLDISVLSSIAEGDTELLTAYKKLSIDSRTGTRTLTPDIVSTAAAKSKIDVDRVVRLINRAQNVSICFVLDTTGSMGSYITGVKDQIVQIVTQVQDSSCGIAGLAFVGYKDWCDGGFII